jgi:mRNA-degrading endonuclease toxin of MazEF toxin-antitoxin module
LAARGTIVYVNLPPPASHPSAETFGAEQAYTRPAVVVQANIIAGSSTVIVVPGTTNPNAGRFQASVLVQPSATNGLTAPTYFLAFQVRAIDAARIRRVAGNLAAMDLEAIERALHGILGL